MPFRTVSVVLLMLVVLGSYEALSIAGDRPARGAAARVRPDLTVSSLSNLPASGSAGSTLTASAGTSNRGRGTSKRSTTRFYVSRDRRLGAGDVAVGQRSVKRLTRKRAVRVQARINIPVATPPGSYFLIACADALKRNKEVNERNNCRATKAQITISVPTTGGGTGGGGTGVGSQPPRACANGNDDDGDGVADSSDPGCADASDDSELGTVQCDDGIDNDGDGKTDFRRASPNHDPGCASLTDNKEATDTAIEVEPNDDGAVSTGGTNGNDFSAANANGPFSATVDISAAITPLGDEDVFAIQVPAAATATLETLNSGGTECGISPDTRLYVRNAAGTQLAFDDDDGTGSCSKISGFALSPGTTYYAHVIDYQDDGTIPSYLLRISIVPN